MYHGIREPRKKANGRLILTLHALICLGICVTLQAEQATPGQPQPAPAVKPPATLQKTETPAAGSQNVRLAVTAFGRYAVMARSEEKVSLRMVDRMAGPGPVSGKPGQEDGRLDLFLDVGDYRLVTSGHPRATGKVRLSVEPFVEKNATPAPVLEELREIETSLQDLEQRSYWLEVKQRRQVIVEAAGRSLGDLRLWKEGKWLVGAQPQIDVIDARVGQPLFVCRLWADLEPGIYLLTAYGRPPQPWSDGSQEHPLYIRSGIPREGVAVRRRHLASPFGIDRFLVPGAANYFRLELGEARSASLRVGVFDPGSPFSEGGSQAEISKKSVPPVAEIQTGSQANDYLVTVKAQPGEAYVVQHFEQKIQHNFSGSATFWLSTIDPGDPRDSIDVNGILVETSADGRSRPIVDQTIELDMTTSWRRRFNVLEGQQLFLHVKEPGAYVVASQGTPARFRIEPFLVSFPQNYRPPALQASGGTWTLDPGWHVLSIQPASKGVLDLAIRPNTWSEYALNAVGVKREIPTVPARASVLFSPLSLNRQSAYTLFVNRRSPLGTVFRALPLDLADPLTVALSPAAEVEVPFRVQESGTLRAESESGDRVEISVNGGAWQTSPPVDSGTHTAKIRQTGKETVYCSLSFQPRRLNPETPLPSMTPETLSRLPEFPVLTEGQPQFLDLNRASNATFRVRADKPGLYLLQSTGLLATEGVVRSRTTPVYARETQNGVGRNFSLRQYLTAGEFQLTVAAQGLSEGHLGVELQRTQPISAGFLTSFTPARISLPAGRAVTYFFKITAEGEFRLRAFGLGRTYRCRLEDGDGWPLVPPGSEADITRVFEPGTYRLTVLPEMTDARVVTTIEPLRRPRTYRGHGPHLLPLARNVNAVWTEPAEGEQRVPDQWEFELPAPGDVSVQLSGEMQATLRRADEPGGPGTAFVPPERGWRGKLEAGRYRLEVTSTRINNRAPYRLAVSPLQLMTGMSREVTAPARVPVSIGERGGIELSSLGDRDVRARLYDNQGNLVAANDDRPDDWNFQIIQTLDPGEYTLKLDPVGAKEARCSVSMRTPDSLEKGQLSVPGTQEITLGRATLIFTVASPAESALLHAQASARDSLGIALEGNFGEGWTSIASNYGFKPELQAPLAGGSETTAKPQYRIKFWSLDRRPTIAHLEVRSIACTPVSEKELAAGLPLSAGPDSSLAVACIRVERDGLFGVETAPGLRWSGDPRAGCSPVDSPILAARQGLIWVTSEVGKGAPLPVARANRIALDSSGGNALQVQYRHGERLKFDLSPSAPGPVLLTARSSSGQPGVMLRQPSRDAAKGEAKWVVADHAAISATLDAQGAAGELWSASPTDDILVVRVEQAHFQTPEVEETPENGDGQIEAGKARRFGLPRGWKRLSLTLGDGLAALLVKGERISTVHWKSAGSLYETLDTDAENLLLLNPGSSPGRFVLVSLPLKDDQALPDLRPGFPYEREHVRAGVERLAVPGGLDGAVLRVRGTDVRLVFVSGSGRTAEGTDIRLDSNPGEILLSHGPGPLVCWIDQAGSDAGLWPAQIHPEQLRIEPPATVPLEGETARAFRIERESPGLLHFRAPGPLLTAIRRPAAMTDTSLHAQGADLAVYLPEGTSELLVRSLAGHPLAGLAEFSLTSATRLQEGAGPTILLSPGDSRLFAFDVDRPGPIGIGVQAESETVELELFQADGKRVEKGTVLMPRLEPGPHLLLLRASPGSGPVKARPVIVGLRLPDTGPPEDVIRQYLQPEGERTSFSSVRGDEPIVRFQTGETEYSEGETGEEESPAAEPQEPEEP